MLTNCSWKEQPNKGLYCTSRLNTIRPTQSLTCAAVLLQRVARSSGDGLITPRGTTRSVDTKTCYSWVNIRLTRRLSTNTWEVRPGVVMTAGSHHSILNLSFRRLHKHISTKMYKSVTSKKVMQHRCCEQTFFCITQLFPNLCTQVKLNRAIH
jgi:hypothetical protein